MSVTASAVRPERAVSVAGRLALAALFAGACALASSPIFVRLPSATGFYPSRGAAGGA